MSTIGKTVTLELTKEDLDIIYDALEIKSEKTLDMGKYANVDKTFQKIREGFTKLGCTKW
jgi:hypothetical protein